MATNLLDIVKDQVSDTLAKQASSYLGASEESISMALGSVFPSILGAIVIKGSSEKGAKSIIDMISGLDQDALADIGNLFGGGQSAVNDLLISGGVILESLLDNKTNMAIELLEKGTKMKISGMMGKLLKMAAPFLLRTIGKHIGAGGNLKLMGLLIGQKEHLQVELPEGMGKVLGFSRIDNTEPTHTAPATENDVESSNSLLKWLLPLLLAAIALYFIGNRGCSGAVEDAQIGFNEGYISSKEEVTDTTDATEYLEKDMANSARNALAKIDEEAKSLLSDIPFSANSAGRQMLDFIEGKGNNTTIRFNNLTFEMGSAKIDAFSATEVDNIATILQVYSGVNIEIQGHTANTGDADSNRILSQARAESVKRRLTAQGIAVNRISTRGYGQDNPVASNASDEGRAQNRRIEVKIMR